MDDMPFDQQNAGYAQAMFEEYARNPEGMPREWRDFFAQGSSIALDAGLLLPEGLSGGGFSTPADAPAPTPTVVEDTETKEKLDSVQRLLPVVARATSFVQAFRDHGHQLAEIDPLGSDPPGHPQLDPSFFGTSMEELEAVPASVVMDGVGAESLAHALQRLRKAYCGPIGYEFEHLEDPMIVRWLWNQVESGVHTQPMERGEKVRLLQRLSEVEGLEQFIHRAYLGQKRFSIEGTDAMVPMLDEIIERAAEAGAHSVVLGMAHRGRLNVLAHTVGIGYEEILREFEGVEAKGAFTVSGTGDVKYHHGAEGEWSLADGSSIAITLAPNPSHLEFVNPVILGMARSMQFEGDSQDAKHNTASVLPVLIHGDAAFAGEGVVAETLNVARLGGYTTGGTVHIIANNQIGFTTLAKDSRSTRYSSDLAKGFSVPIIHVNGDNPEACLSAVRLAMAYRAEYHDDVVIDLVGYRRHGHNEGDEPAYTQPMIYAGIRNHPTVGRIWEQRLIDDGDISEADATAIRKRVNDYLREAQDAVQEEGRVEGVPEEMEDTNLGDSTPVETAVDLAVLGEVNAALLDTPDDFTVHPKLARQLNRRGEGFGPEFAMEWAHAEALAFASLLGEGVPVRLTGQDVERGTFSHRHLVLHDAETGEECTPLVNFGSARFEIHNSPLSEMAIVGFEYGVSVMEKKQLVLWEAQFGDFVNCAQVSIDQFVSSGWEKWGQTASLVLLLPHGYEGQGPEHSSARLERFLQLCAEDNMRVISPTTPANYFHVLRLQAHTQPQRPLVVMNPKSLLRHPKATSTVAELAEGEFRRVIDDASVPDRTAIDRLVLCTGKVYYDLTGSELRSDANTTAIARVEELYPFPGDDLTALVAGYPNLKEVVWVQEEPRNMGALSYIGPRLRGITPRTIALRHVARPDRASPAEGRHINHVVEQARVIREALHA
jgi:2-oxoglutarate dehydrogenase E1 component